MDSSAMLDTEKHHRAMVRAWALELGFPGLNLGFPT